MFLFLFLIKITFILFVSSEKVVQLPLIKIEGRYHLVPSIKISNNSDITFFNAISLKKQEYLSDYYMINDSDFFKNTPYTIIEINNIGIQCKIITTQLTFGTDTHLNFTFLNSKETFPSNLEEPGFPFPVHIQNKQYSLLYHAIQDKLINKFIFGIENLSKDKGYLYLGGLPSSSKSNKYITTCHIEKRPNTLESIWGCKLNYIYIGNYHKDNSNIYINNQNYYSSFDTNVSYIISPGSFIEYLRENVFNKYISNDQCTYLQKEGKFECLCEIIDKLEEITFAFGKEFKIKMKNLGKVIGSKGDKLEKYCQFNIIKNDGKNEWIFGTSFLDNYDIEFYPEKEEIKFISVNRFMDATLLNGKHINLNRILSLRKILYIIIIMESIPCIGILIIILFNYNKLQSVNFD